ncbi:MAG: hypothetical protein ISS79_05020 [Phycisphaerae bacterium]|nr:hypothetical protein [Phycisphaerae bacterium]
MKNAAALLTVITALSNSLFADSWARPVEKDYFSQNKGFVAHVTPAKDGAKTKLEMFQIKNAERIPLWQCTLGNEGAPQYIFLTDDGRYVATVNENNDRVHGGMGDYVVAFYNKTGLIKNYSLEQILHYTGPPNRLYISKELRHLVSRSVSGRSWALMPMFFDRQNDKLYFCVWLYYGKYFLAWDPTTGAEVKVTDDLKNRWNNKGRIWALAEGMKSRSYGKAVEFLLNLKRPEDRKVIESLLTAEAKFYTQPVHDWNSKNKTLLRLNSSSPKRATAERALARWDGKLTENKDRSQKYYYLGTVSGTIHLPEAPGPDGTHLCLYLVPGDSIPDDWHKSVPVHRVTEYFWKYSFHNTEWPGKDIPFRIQGVTPGTYTLKAVWDKAAPHTFADDYIKAPPQQGDYESTSAPTITVRAGEKVENIKTDCTHKVRNGTD